MLNDELINHRLTALETLLTSKNEEDTKRWEKMFVLHAKLDKRLSIFETKAYMFSAGISFLITVFPFIKNKIIGPS